MSPFGICAPCFDILHPMCEPLPTYNCAVSPRGAANDSSTNVTNHTTSAATGVQDRTFWSLTQSKVGAIERAPHKGGNGGLELASRYVWHVNALQHNVAEFKRSRQDNGSIRSGQLQITWDRL